MIKNLVTKKQFVIKSKFNVYRCYSSVASFCILIKKILDQKQNLYFIERNKIINFTSNKILNLENLVNYIKKTGLFKNSKIIFQNKVLFKERKIHFSSKFTNKLYSKKDKFFLNEIKKINFYVKKNFV